MTQRSKLSHWGRRLQEAFIGLMLLAITVVIFANVVLRYAFGASLSWAEEFARYGVIWLTLVGGSVCIYRGLHIAVDVWGEMLSQRVNRVWTLGVHLISAITCGAFTWYAMQLVFKAVHTKQKTIALGLPMWLMYGAMAVGGVLMCVQFLALMWAAPEASQEPNLEDAYGPSDEGSAP